MGKKWMGFLSNLSNSAQMTGFSVLCGRVLAFFPRLPRGGVAHVLGNPRLPGLLCDSAPVLATCGSANCLGWLLVTSLSPLHQPAGVPLTHTPSVPFSPDPSPRLTPHLGSQFLTFSFCKPSPALRSLEFWYVGQPQAYWRIPFNNS